MPRTKTENLNEYTDHGAEYTADDAAKIAAGLGNVWQPRRGAARHYINDLRGLVGACDAAGASERLADIKVYVQGSEIMVQHNDDGMVWRIEAALRRWLASA